MATSGGGGDGGDDNDDDRRRRAAVAAEVWTTTSPTTTMNGDSDEWRRRPRAGTTRRLKDGSGLPDIVFSYTDGDDLSSQRRPRCLRTLFFYTRTGMTCHLKVHLTMATVPPDIVFLYTDGDLSLCGCPLNDGHGVSGHYFFIHGRVPIVKWESKLKK